MHTTAQVILQSRTIVHRKRIISNHSDRRCGVFGTQNFCGSRTGDAVPNNYICLGCLLSHYHPPEFQDEQPYKDGEITSIRFLGSLKRPSSRDSSIGIYSNLYGGKWSRCRPLNDGGTLSRIKNGVVAWTLQ